MSLMMDNIAGDEFDQYRDDGGGNKSLRLPDVQRLYVPTFNLTVGTTSSLWQATSSNAKTNNR